MVADVYGVSNKGVANTMGRHCGPVFGVHGITSGNTDYGTSAPDIPGLLGTTVRYPLANPSCDAWANFYHQVPNGGDDVRVLRMWRLTK